LAHHEQKDVAARGSQGGADADFASTLGDATGEQDGGQRDLGDDEDAARPLSAAGGTCRTDAGVNLIARELQSADPISIATSKLVIGLRGETALKLRDEVEPVYEK
jgi:hypothetical protein